MTMTGMKIATPFALLTLWLALGLVLALSGCGGTQPVRYSEVATTTYLAPNDGDDAETVPYRYAPPVDWRTYNKAIIDPVVVYQGPDQQFGDLAEKDRQALARYMEAQFSERLKQRFVLVNTVQPGTIRVRLTLTGAETSTAVLSTLTRFDIAGGIYNGVQAARGGEGMLTGSVSYVVEIFDATTSKLLSAYITKQYPGPYNLGATMGSLSASEVGIEKGADALVEQLR
jgi:hypothetical protein